MSRSTKKSALPKILAATAIAAGLYGLAVVAERVLRSDPFAGYRQSNSSTDPNAPAIVMRNTTLRGYQEGKLVMTAKAATIEVTEDRNVYTVSKVTDGQFLENAKVSWGFSADKGVWQDQIKNLVLEGNIRALNPDMDLRVARLEYSNLSHDLKIDSPIKGQFMKGDVSAENLALNMKSKKWRLGRVLWVGALPQQAQDTPVPASKKWTIKADYSTGENKTSTWFKATATNGEVEIRADKIEQFVDPATNKEVLVATGSVRYFGQEANVLCERVTVFREERRAILEGKVTMMIKPEDQTGLKAEPLQPMRPILPEEIGSTPAGPPTTPSDPNGEIRRTDNFRKYPIRILAQRIEYWYRKGQRKALISGSPQAQQNLPEGQWRMIWAPGAEWNGETDMLTLRGEAKKQEVRMRASNGDAYRCDSFSISTKKDEDRWTMSNPAGEGDVGDEEIPGTGNSGSGKGKPTPLQGPIGNT